ncbi:MAG: hypothetical protein Q4F00_01825 [bacterium]|nr:hypothetical protein [bacterium]
MKLSYKLITLALAFGAACGWSLAEERLSTDQLRDLVEQGETGYMATYATRLLFGDGTEADIKLGRELMEKAAAANKPDGKYGLGLCYYYGFGAFDLSQTYNYMLGASEAGYKPAFNSLGHCYEEGLGVASNYHQARRCFFQSSGDLDSQCMAVKLLDYRRTPFAVNPREVGQNINQALAMFGNAEQVAMTPTVYEFLYNAQEQSRSAIAKKLAHKSGNKKRLSAAELYNWGRLYELALATNAVSEKDGTRQMWEYYKDSAQRKFVPAQIAIARLQARSRDEQGLASLKAYSETGYWQAKQALLELYETQEAPKMLSGDDYTALLQELRQKGYHGASTKLAEYYASTAKDSAKAWQYTLAAADDGEAIGCYKAAEFYRTGKDAGAGVTVKPDPEKAYAYLHTLCRDLPRADYQRLDMCRAFTNLGNMYYYGKGCPQDTNQAEEWYNVALNTRGGEKLEANYRLGSLYIEKTDKRQLGAEMLRGVAASSSEYAKSARYLLTKHKL